MTVIVIQSEESEIALGEEVSVIEIIGPGVVLQGPAGTNGVNAGADLAVFASGYFASSEVLWDFDVVRAFTLPAGLTGSRCRLREAATASAVFTIARNGTVVGTATFAPGGTTATLAMASLTTFAVDDVLTLTAPATPDATAAGLRLTLKGTLTP